MVQKMVTMTEKNVIVEQEQPKVLVRSSKRSDQWGQMSGLAMGERREFAGMQVED